MRTAGSVTLIAALVLTACGSSDGTGKSGLANPASAFCEKQGGTTENTRDSAGNERGICVLADGSRIDEWTYYRLHGHGRLTERDLRGLLLSTSDFDAGWTARVVADDPNDDPRPIPGHIDPMLCPAGSQELVDIAGKGELDEKTAVLPQVTAELRGPLNVSINESLWATSTVKKEFAVLQHAITTCAGARWTWEAGDTFEIAPAEAPRVGDEAAAFTLTVSPSSGESHAVRVIVARFGSALLWMDVQSFGSPMSDASWRDIVAMAAVKLP